ncbi:MAG TPA: SRPBCC domain-containing protein [Longimicrobiaceae bacterium]|nr:SRPBCC domain-containing protein [Longimicrobiaceae bacterium]
MKLRLLRDLFRLDAPPAVVYDALLRPPAPWGLARRTLRIYPRPGGPVQVDGGDFSGWNLVLEPGARIVQAWTARGWPQDHYSIARFDLVSAVRGTNLVFSHYGVPADECDRVRTMWSELYWEPLRGAFDGSAR